MNYTYYYIKDALDVCDIDVVVLEVFGMFYEEDDTGVISEGVRDSSLNAVSYTHLDVYKRQIQKHGLNIPGNGKTP